jgi:hypothetical protein
MGVLFILAGLVPLVWIFLLRAPIGQWIRLREFLDSFYFVDSNRFVGSACVLLLLGVPGVILLIKGLRR